MQKNDKPAPTPKTDPAGVSVIIPAYNYARHLPAAIDSVLAQTYGPIETIVIDDGSTDNTREVVAAYGDRVRYVHQANTGLSAARNKGVELASYALVAFLDADDVFHPEMISRLIARLAALGTQYVLVACGHVYIDEDGGPLPKVMKNRVADGEVSGRDLLLKDRFAADAVIVRRHAILAAGAFDSDLRSAEDRDLWIRLGQFGRQWRIAEALVKVRVHPGSMSTRPDRMMANIRRVLRKARRAGVVSPWHVFVWARVYAVFFSQSAWMYHDAGCHVKGALEVVKSVLVWPIFLRTRWLGEPPLFRLRSLRRFLWAACRGR